MAQRVAKRKEQHGSRGAAVLEMAIVALLLLTLIFGVITYAYMMSFRQSMTQAAAEGARAGAVTVSSTSVNANATAAVTQALGGYGIGCGGTGVTCNVTGPVACPNNAARQCITVELRYPYRSRPLLPAFPGLNLTLPTELVTTSVAEWAPSTGTP
jgi:Flp pilus assembly protein TadG